MPLISTSALDLASAALRDLDSHQNGKNLSKKAHLQELLSNNGLGLPEVVENLRLISLGAEREETRLRANELILRLHDVLRDEKEATQPTIVFQIQSENVNLAFLKPAGA